MECIDNKLSMQVKAYERDLEILEIEMERTTDNERAIELSMYIMNIEEKIDYILFHKK